MLAGSVRFEAATRAHAEALAELLRPEDVAEVVAFGYATGRDALIASLESSEEAFSALTDDGEVLAMWGVIPLRQTMLGEVGALIWFLSGRGFPRYAKTLSKAARIAVRVLGERYGTLGNYIDARYEAAVRFARWVGFQVGEPVPVGPHGHLFRGAILRRKSWVQAQA